MSDLSDNPLIDSALFYPREARPGSSRLTGVTDGTIPVGEGIVVGYRLYAHRPGQPVIVYFHGNAEVAADYDDVASLYHVAGASLMVVDYRGYGWSTGRPAVASLLPDAEAAARALPALLVAAGLHDSPRCVMGRSLGSACAIHLASATPQAWRGLILDSSFAYVGPLLVRLGLMLSVPVERDPVGNLDKMRRISTPLLVLHGEADMLVPVSDGQALFDASPALNKTIKRFPGAGHNDLLIYAQDYFAAIEDFLVTCGL
jgi:alpha-beta hydrolase superfamily lysophospholipase